MCPVLIYMHDCQVQIVMVSFRCLQLPNGRATLAQTATAMSVVCPTILPGGSDFWRPIVTSDIVFPWERTDQVSFFCVVSCAIYYSLLIHNILQHSSIQVFQKDKHCYKRFYFEENTALV